MASTTDAAADAWLSDFLQRPARLVRMTTDARRVIASSHAHTRDGGVTGFHSVPDETLEHGQEGMLIFVDVDEVLARRHLSPEEVVRDGKRRRVEHGRFKSVGAVRILTAPAPDRVIALFRNKVPANNAIHTSANFARLVTIGARRWFNVLVKGWKF